MINGQRRHGIYRQWNSSARKKMKAYYYVTTRMDLEGIMLSDIS